ncbi:MAG: aminotransferase class I/II-fold pyridoxal phosphate-dependent enzyme [Phycisphaera sp.]|nr:aminotransferase class I/II-fold pyridoxal phosphate-dependent enzyme [Phycisphaera sp.]
MDRWLDELDSELANLGRAHMRRVLRSSDTAGLYVQRRNQRLVNLAGNDYLGLASHPHMRQAVVKAIERFGTGSTASRLTCGTLDIHEQVESRLARFKHAAAALLCPTGYMANLAVVTSLVRDGRDVVFLDKLCHASLIDAARLSGATVRVYPHLKYDKLERLLQKHVESVSNERGELSAGCADDADFKADETDAGPDGSGHEKEHVPNLRNLRNLRIDPDTRQSVTPPRRIILTDSVFSMDGDVADLVRLCDLADRYDAILIVDEAHATGVLGETGAGLSELQGVTHRVDVTVSTASKALGSLGGIVTSSRTVIDTIINRARSLIYTTAVPPGQAAAVDAALDILEREPQRRQRLSRLSRTLREALSDLPPAFRHDMLGPTAVATPIIPLIVGSPEAALSIASHLEKHGFLAPAIRPPTVAPGSSRVRISLRSDMAEDHVAQLARACRQWIDTNT